MESDNITQKMKNTKTVVDDLVYTMLSEVSSRFLEEVDREVVRRIMTDIREEYDLGDILVRKKPSKSSKNSRSKSETKKKDGYVSDILEKTRSKKKRGLVWEDCSDVEGMPKVLRKYQFCNNKDLELEDNCSLLAEQHRNNIIVVGVINELFQVRDISIRESKKFLRFDLNVLEENIVPSSKIAFNDVE